MFFGSHFPSSYPSSSRSRLRSSLFHVVHVNDWENNEKWGCVRYYSCNQQSQQTKFHHWCPQITWNVLLFCSISSPSGRHVSICWVPLESNFGLFIKISCESGMRMNSTISSHNVNCQACSFTVHTLQPVHCHRKLSLVPMWWCPCTNQSSDCMELQGDFCGEAWDDCVGNHAFESMMPQGRHESMWKCLLGQREHWDCAQDQEKEIQERQSSSCGSQSNVIVVNCPNNGDLGLWQNTVENKIHAGTSAHHQKHSQGEACIVNIFLPVLWAHTGKLMWQNANKNVHMDDREMQWKDDTKMAKGDLQKGAMPIQPACMLPVHTMLLGLASKTKAVKGEQTSDNCS